MSYLLLLSCSGWESLELHVYDCVCFQPGHGWLPISVRMFTCKQSHDWKCSFLRVYFASIGLAHALRREAKASNPACREEGICLCYSERKYLPCYCSAWPFAICDKVFKGCAPKVCCPPDPPSITGGTQGWMKHQPRRRSIVSAPRCCSESGSRGQSVSSWFPHCVAPQGLLHVHLLWPQWYQPRGTGTRGSCGSGWDEPLGCFFFIRKKENQKQLS